MHADPAEVIEWHIFEGPNSNSVSQPMHMGPFASEQACRAVLASLKDVPGIRHDALEVRPQARRREKRIRIKLSVQIRRVISPDKIWDAHTYDISRMGARLSDPTRSLKLGEFLQIRYGQREAVFRVVWLGLQKSSTHGQVGVECLSPEINIWDLDFSARTDDEPLIQEIVVARAVQRQLFPREKPLLRTLDYCGKCIQARTVGGDYYDFLDMGAGSVGFVLADIAGKGVGAALLMANLQGSIHNRAGIEVPDLRALLTAVNRHLFEYSEPDRYATLFFGCYSDFARTLTYVNCGHTTPLLLRENGGSERLESTATVLGLFGTWDCSVAQTEIRPGDVLSIFTDGITEARSARGEEFGEKRLFSVLQESRELQATDILGKIERELQDFRSGEQLHDDLTLVIARAK
jgi:hypothetical protein